MKVYDLDDPKIITEKKWTHAISQWLKPGEEQCPDYLATLIKELDIPADAREFLTDMVMGKVNKGKGGSPQRYSQAFQRQITAEVYEIWDTKKKEPRWTKKGSPKDIAMWVVAERHDLNEDKVRGIVNRVGEFITPKLWEKMGRPTFNE